jgi:hypothetical protein
MHVFGRKSPVHAAVWSLIVVIAATSGCDEKGPLLHEVAGVVRLDGVPLTNGSVSLRPDGNASNFEQPTGSISRDGAFRVYTHSRPGAPPGRYRVVVFSSETSPESKAAHPGLPKSAVPAQYCDPAKTPLTAEVIDSPEPGRYDLELVRDAKPSR